MQHIVMVHAVMYVYSQFSVSVGIIIQITTI